MAEPSSTSKIQVSRKGLLAVFLCLVMLVLTGRMLLQLYEEGDKVCDALQARLANKPGERMPCTALSYPVAPYNRMAMSGAGGSALQTSSVAYRFSKAGDLRRVETDRNDDGAADITYRCSILGKLLMPLTNYDAWLSYSTYESLARTAEPAQKNLAKEGSAGVTGLHTRLTAVGDPRAPYMLQLNSATRGADGRVLRQVAQGMKSGAFTVTRYEYDERGDLSSSWRTTVRHPYSYTRRTDYTYACWD